MLNKLKKIDIEITGILLLFMVISTLVVRSATYGDSDYPNYDTKTLIFYTLGFIVMICVTLFDYRVLVKGSLLIYGIGILSLIAVYFLGENINGARGWFRVGAFLIQPAEFVKLAIIITVAYFLQKRQGEPLRIFADVIPIGIVVFVPFALVMIQPDLGNAVIYIVILLGMFWIGNIKLSHATIGLLIMGAFLGSFLYVFNAFGPEIKQYLNEQDKGHWYQRINTFVNPSEASNDEQYQVRNSMIAIGSGSLTGDGYMNGNSKNKRFIPFAYSDSIFVVIGEEFGFVGASVLLLLYFLLIYRMILIAIQCRELSGSFIIVGIVSMFVFQIFENVGMLIGLMPLTGITLPFISYGGSSLLINMACIGIVLSIKAHQEAY
ncbi:cell cycle protein [Paenibacillus swuensis]|uniref:Cell cycle protein n=1 Tax=Paenibacillus swuensis TaxID=1178515 RepID=A0A172TJE7_9BACL|nr:FtsW/RodA/SpoVE family cell cycle protein [Paenibacillus swuensis]ANE47171.1 cell cycle protein [Paenibacillus swuensis]